MTNNYNVPHNTFPGSEPPPKQPGVLRLDEPLNTSYLQTIGIYSLDGVAIAQYQLAGEQTTSLGDLLTYNAAVGNEAEGIHYEQQILLDFLGAGPGSVKFANRPDGTYGVLQEAPSGSSTTATPGKQQNGSDGTGTDSTQVSTEGQTTTSTSVDEDTQETVTETTYEPDPTIQQGGGYIAPPDTQT